MKPSEASQLLYARVAGFKFLFYIIAGMTSMALGSQSQVTDLLTLLQNFSALLLGVTLFMLTYQHGPALALLALICRAIEAVNHESAIRSYEYELSRTLLDILVETPGVTVYGMTDTRRLKERVPTAAFTLVGKSPRQVVLHYVQD